jgi:hypothetical protein
MRMRRSRLIRESLCAWKRNSETRATRPRLDVALAELECDSVAKAAEAEQLSRAAVETVFRADAYADEESLAGSISGLQSPAATRQSWTRQRSAMAECGPAFGKEPGCAGSHPL